MWIFFRDHHVCSEEKTTLERNVEKIYNNRPNESKSRIRITTLNSYMYSMYISAIQSIHSHQCKDIIGRYNILYISLSFLFSTQVMCIPVYMQEELCCCCPCLVLYTIIYTGLLKISNPLQDYSSKTHNYFTFQRNSLIKSKRSTIVFY